MPRTVTTTTYVAQPVPSFAPKQVPPPPPPPKRRPTTPPKQPIVKTMLLEEYRQWCQTTARQQT
eukprot:3660253-Lingulodinium_polyedra.AAC.1